MYTQVDPDGHSRAILDCIIDFKKDDRLLRKENIYIITKSGRRHMGKITSE